MLQPQILNDPVSEKPLQLSETLCLPLPSGPRFELSKASFWGDCGRDHMGPREEARVTDLGGFDLLF